MRKYVKPVSELVSICMNENIAESASYSIEGKFTIISDGNGNLKTTNLPFQPLLGYSKQELLDLYGEHFDILKGTGCLFSVAG